MDDGADRFLLSLARFVELMSGVYPGVLRMRHVRVKGECDSMLKIFLALISVFMILAITTAVRVLMFPVRRARGFFAQKAIAG